MAFYYDPLSDRGWHEQLQRSHDQTNLINNIDDIVKAQTEEYNAVLREVSQEQAEIMRASTEAICGTISDGLADVTDGLHGVENAIYRMTNLLDCHLQTIIGELKYNNILAQNIALLLREPDSEKVRQKNIEKGLKFHRDALLGHPFFYNDALLFLRKAIEDEQTGDHTDYFVLHRIGLIYLYSTDHLNYERAISYFQKSATYSEVDTHPNAKRLASVLNADLDVRRPLEAQQRTIDDIRVFTGHSYMQISIAYYCQGKFKESIEYAEKAFKIAPSLLEAGFRWAKSLAASGQNEKAAQVLKPVIQQDEVYSIRTLNDPDLATKPEIFHMNQQLRQEERENAQALYNESSQLKEKVINEWKITESSLFSDFNDLCRNLDIAKDSMERDRYLSFLRAKRHLKEFISKL
jgi:tetratricopeptide (TPR) repeat protein